MSYNKRFLIATYLLLSFHVVGLIGLSHEGWQPLFLLLTPFNLLLSAFIVFFFHKAERAKLWAFIALTASGGFIVEAVGVATGWPFGVYWYGASLGPKVLGVPLIIALNWSLLVYCTGVVAAMVFQNIWLRALLGAALMVVIDLPIEPVAPLLDFWHWELGHAPLINYLGWYVAALILQLVFIKSLGYKRNMVALVYAITVFLFFVALNFLLR